METDPEMMLESMVLYSSDAVLRAFIKAMNEAATYGRAAAKITQDNGRLNVIHVDFRQRRGAS